jgi:two-component system chemotaxis response regulator CheY
MMTSSSGIALFIDDDAAERARGEPLLRAQGYTVELADGGAAALALLRKGLRPAVILVDLFMPGIDAVGFRRQQVAEPAWVAIPTIILATTNFRGFPAGAMGMTLLRKPFDATALAEALQAAGVTPPHPDAARRAR